MGMVAPALAHHPAGPRAVTPAQRRGAGAASACPRAGGSAPGSPRHWPLARGHGRPTLTAMARPGIRRSGNARALPGPLWESPFMRACRGLQAQYTPVWLMRQAGRYMPHYRSLRSAHSFLALCKDPALSAEVTIHARDWLGVDAAIIFSDILVVLEALGMPLAFSDGDGPSLSRPLRTLSDIEALTDPRAAAATLGYVNEAIGLSVRGLPAEVPLIGFCGAPFTLAAYAI